MLLIREIKIRNFVCFDDVTIRPSTSSERPLTVIRAENGSGKTTLLRAIRWAMYGDEALPGRPNHFSLHPAEWVPDARGIETEVSIEFETDGSSRDHPEANSTNTLFELCRKVTTYSKKPRHSNDTDFRRADQSTNLIRQSFDGSWKPHPSKAEEVVKQLLPWELRDFFVMDADEAADFVGGSDESKILTRTQVIEKTSYAVAALLGIRVFEQAKERVDKIGRKFGRLATKAAGNTQLTKRQQELDSRKDEEQQLSKAINLNQRRKGDLEYRRQMAFERLEVLVGNISEHESLKNKLAQNRIARQAIKKQLRDSFADLSQQVSAIELLAALAASEIQNVRNTLKPLHDQGLIPSWHLGFVQSLLDKGSCVCGLQLHKGSERRAHLEHIVHESQHKAEGANRLAESLHAANELNRHTDSGEWRDQCNMLESNIATYEEELEELALEKRAIDSKLQEIDDQEIQVIRDEISSLDHQLQTIQRDLGKDEFRYNEIKKLINHLEGKVRNLRKRHAQSRILEANHETARVLVDILDEAFSVIRNTQVEEVDKEMNHLFSRMATNVTDDADFEGNRKRATLQMIARVGLRALDEDPESFEIFALNNRGRSMPPTEINGASRRILALSFVLALCKVSRTHAPLVADSLLNVMSGSVRTNALQATAETANQPILLLTGSDLESQSEVDLVSKYAGATYTLTPQWQHVAEGGDVVNQTDARQVSLICSCGPRDFCDRCERVGQEGLVGWKRREREV